MCVFCGTCSLRVEDANRVLAYGCSARIRARHRLCQWQSKALRAKRVGSGGLKCVEIGRKAFAVGHTRLMVKAYERSNAEVSEMNKERRLYMHVYM